MRPSFKSFITEAEKHVESISEFKKLQGIDAKFAAKLKTAWDGDARDWEKTKGKDFDPLFIRMVGDDAVKKFAPELTSNSEAKNALKRLKQLHVQAFPVALKSMNKDTSVWSHERWVKESADVRSFEFMDELLSEGFRHVSHALIKTRDHFGTQNENPEGYANLTKALKLLGKKVPDDKVWAYEAGSFPAEFKRMSRLHKVRNPESPDIDDLLNASFAKAGLYRGTRFYTKDNVVAMFSEGKSVTYIVADDAPAKAAAPAAKTAPPAKAPVKAAPVKASLAPKK